MQISLQEDDSMFHGGTPQLVVLVVKFDNGNTKRIPYEACKTIASLYQDLYAIAPQVAGQPQSDIMPIEDALPEIGNRLAKAKAEIAVETIRKTFVHENV